MVLLTIGNSRLPSYFHGERATFDKVPHRRERAPVGTPGTATASIESFAVVEFLNAICAMIHPVSTSAIEE
jgi:hypothetical protein